MKTALRLAGCLLLPASLCFQAWISVDAQSDGRTISDFRRDETPAIINLPTVENADFTDLLFPSFERNLLLPPMVFSNETKRLLYLAISDRIGVRYRYYGTDEAGFDCSGFVWRVFQDAGASFDRVAARTLWRELPEANDTDKIKFGTLVFFNGLKHVGIVRDAFSFYHASRSKGVTLSFFAGYWSKRVTGYRKAPIQIEPQAFVPAG